MDLEYYVINVFSEKKLAGGNQLAVFPFNQDLNHHEMLTIAREMNFSESTFITKNRQEYLQFKIYLPDDEAEYAGHPTIGTSYLDEYLHRIDHDNRVQRRIILKGGELNVYFDSKLDITYMEQLPVKHLGDFDKVDSLIDVLGIHKSDLISRVFPVYSPSSFKFLNIAVKDPETVQRLEPNFSEMTRVLGSSNFLTTVFSPKGIDGGDVHVRTFAPGSGINEDPATGSAQGALIHAMHRLKLLENRSSIIVEQGYGMNRPSKLYNRMQIAGNQIQSVQTGGKCYIAAHGTLFMN